MTSSHRIFGASFLLAASTLLSALSVELGSEPFAWAFAVLAVVSFFSLSEVSISAGVSDE